MERGIRRGQCAGPNGEGVEEAVRRDFAAAGVEELWMGKCLSFLFGGNEEEAAGKGVDIRGQTKLHCKRYPSGIDASGNEHCGAADKK
jgi:hypothetical protein